MVLDTDNIDDPEIRDQLEDETRIIKRIFREHENEIRSILAEFPPLLSEAGVTSIIFLDRERNGKDQVLYLWPLEEEGSERNKIFRFNVDKNVNLDEDLLRNFQLQLDSHRVKRFTEMIEDKFGGYKGQS